MLKVGRRTAELFHQVLSRAEFAERPPVLLDIGASGGINPKWRAIAPYALCIAFDADDREMNSVVSEADGYRKLLICNRVLTESAVGCSTPFYLTESPYCSSRLQPKELELSQWEFAPLFRVRRIVELKTVSVPELLEREVVRDVDWFKADSQGTDLRLFKSLGKDLEERVIVAEFEPGIIDAYEGEDKLWKVLEYMERRGFWLSEMRTNGSLRVSRDLFRVYPEMNHSCLGARIPTAPGWAEVTFLNSFNTAHSCFGTREYLLGWVFAVIEGQLGFALEIARHGKHRFDDAVFDAMEAYTVKRMQWTPRVWAIRFAQRLMRRMARKFFSERWNLV